ncbi:MAG: SH3 domain-containing protein [Bacteroidota bacterium]
MKKYFAFILFFIAAASEMVAQETSSFQQATESYNKGEYQSAIDRYTRILESGKHSAALYFNLGNCYYKLDEIGPSIYYYEKALLLQPQDEEILDNLRFAQNMRLDAIEEMPKTAMARLHDAVVLAFSFDQWATIAVVMLSLFVTGYITYYVLYSATKKRIAFISGTLALFLAFFAIAMAYLGYQDFKTKNPAIIFEREVGVTSEPNERSEKVFVLHEGTKVNVMDTLENWYKIKIADGQTGWIPSESLKLVKDF